MAPVYRRIVGDCPVSVDGAHAAQPGQYAPLFRHAIFCIAKPFFCTVFMRRLLSSGCVQQPGRPPSAP
ncbi:hypothetical protein BDI4_120049 [Burkholderia diffusa]|nr:hypothetical protein BDI4_120049 [Burkholderia diffusa]